MGHVLGAEKEFFLIRGRGRPTVYGGRASGILSIPAQKVSLGSPRVGTIHVQSPIAMALTCAGPQCAPRLLTDFREAESVLIDALPRFRRVMGNLHPTTRKARNLLDKIKSRMQEVP